MKACVECVQRGVEHGHPCLDCKFYWDNPDGRSYFEPKREEMSNASLAHKIANQLNRACALEITTTAIETIEECLGEAMHTEKDLRLTSKIAKRAELEHDIEIWRQAYNAAISAVAYAVGTGTAGSLARDYADMALADYRAQREEVGKR